jgi:hypothetical protein
MPASATRSRFLPRPARYATIVSAAPSSTNPAATYDPVVGAKRYSPWLKTTGLSEKKNRKMASSTEFLRILPR